MKIPESPPVFSNFQEELPQIIPFLSNPGVQSLFRKANTDYVHWENFKHWAMPEGVSPSLAWKALKFERSIQRRATPIMDVKGHAFSYSLAEGILRSLHEVDRDAPRRLEMEYPLSRQTQHRDRYILSSLMEEAIASSQLEGAATTRQIAKEMLRSGRPPRNISERMILNNYRVMQHIREIPDQDLTMEALCEIHRIAVQDTLETPAAAGRFRASEEPIQVFDPRDDSVLFTPPPADQLRERVEAFLNFANQEDPKEFTHPVIKGILLHFWMAYLHPFVDGNGRTARALFYWYLMRRGYWIFEFISISRVLRLAPAQYMRAYLYTEHDANDLNYFIVFNLRAIRLSLEALEIYLLRKQHESQRIPDLLQTFPGITARQAGLLIEVLEDRGKQLTIEEHRQNQKVTYQTARTDLLNLVSKGLLRQSKEGKRFIFTVGGVLSHYRQANHSRRVKSGK